VKNKSFVLFSLLFLIGSFEVISQSLRINEVSQGTVGSQEYIELLVIGNASTDCAQPPVCLDLRGWIIDDNNGYFSGGPSSGTGIAPGAIRFANNPFWACVNPGTLILIYNNNDINPAVPPQDISTIDQNCRFVIPISSTLFDRHDTSPNNTSSAYATTGWVSGGNWIRIGMANGDDAIQIYAPTNTTVPVHGVSWGNNNQNQIIYFAGAAGGLVFSATNTTSTNFSVQTNWTSASASTNQTPGIANSTQNASLIDAMNLSCTEPLSINVNITSETCATLCDGAASITISGGVTPYLSTTWSTGATGNQIQNMCGGTYSVTVVDANNCSITEQVTIPTGSGINLTLSPNNSICDGETITLSATGATNYLWSPTNESTASIQVSPSSTTTYSVTGSTTGCSATQSVTITVNPLPSIEIDANATTICQGITATLTATGATTYNWMPGNQTTSSIAISPTTTTTYTLTGIEGGCSSTETVTITVNPIPSVILNITGESCDSFCNGGASVVIQGGTPPYASAVWSTGASGSQIINACGGNYSVTVVDANLCFYTEQFIIPSGININLSVTPNVTICEGQSTILSATGASTYNWAPTNETTSFIQVSPNSTANYTVTGTSAGCSANQTVTVTVNPTPQVSAGNDITTCLGSEVILTASGTATSYVWTNGIQNGTAFTPTLGATTYSVTGSSNGCTATDELLITVLTDLEVNAGNDTTLCFGSNYQFKATGASEYTWNSGNINGEIEELPIGISFFEVEGTSGSCSGLDQVVVTVIDCEWELELPNVVTPNNDGLNDLFEAVTLKAIEISELLILNRWGNEIYRTNITPISWDLKAVNGEIITDGVYYYLVKFVTPIGQNLEKSGFFQVLKN
jgi:gliding motility-associated-like protein